MKPIREKEHHLDHVHPDTPSHTQPMMKIMKKLAELDAARDLTAREFISLCALASVLSSPVDAKTRDNTTDVTPRHKEIAAVLAHLSALRHYGLEHRSFAKGEYLFGPPKNTGSRFLAAFFDGARGGLETWFSQDFSYRTWDTYDLFDGRLFISISALLEESDANLPWQLSQRAVQMAKLVDELVGNPDTVEALSTCGILHQQSDASTGVNVFSPTTPQLGQQSSEIAPSVLPFNHPIMDQYLRDVRLRPNGTMTEPPVSSKLFQELQHWHNARNPLDPKHVAKPLDFFAARRHQRLMAGTIDYAASLTGVSGKALEPEIVISLKQAGNGKNKPTPKHATGATQKVKGTRANSKSYKQKALEEGEARRQEKLVVLRQSAAAVWRERCADFEKQPSPLKRFLRAEKYLASISPAQEAIIGSEVLVYLGNVLLNMRRNPKTPQSAGWCLVSPHLRKN